jgi:phage gp29-like protein
MVMADKNSFTQRGLNKAINFLQGFQRTSSPVSPLQKDDATNIRYYISPIQLERLAHDASMWRQAIVEAENAMMPHRVKMQRMFADTILEGHTLSCIKKRKRLSMLKDFVIEDESGKVNEQASKLIKNRQWFSNLISYILDAQFFGYSLINLGDMISPDAGRFDFPKLQNIRRWHISPDRQNLVTIPYRYDGINFTDPSERDEHGVSYYDYSIYVDTPSDIGHSVCGYGLLYDIAQYAIILRNNLTDNADYTQSFSTPYRHAKTSGTLNNEVRKNLENSLTMMGSLGWLITPDNVTIDFHESNSGNGYKGYESLEVRCEKRISKLILGHGDAIDSTPGKLGGGQGSGKEGEESSAVSVAIAETEKEQDAWLLNILNDQVLPKLRKLGFPIAKGLRIGTTRDKEETQARIAEDAANKTTAEIAQTMKNAGFKMDAKYFTDRTGIPCEEVEEEPAVIPGASAAAMKIRNMYK